MSGLLGKIVTNANQYVQAYQVPAVDVEFATINVNIVNTANTTAEVDVAISSDANPSNADLIGWKDELVSNGGSVEYSCYILSPGERVFVRSNNSETIVRVSGLIKEI